MICCNFYSNGDMYVSYKLRYRERYDLLQQERAARKYHMTDAGYDTANGMICCNVNDQISIGVR